MYETSSTVATIPPENWMPTRGVRVTGVEQLRKRKLWSQQQLAEAAGIGRGTVIRAEKGHAIDLPIVAKLAEALNVEPDELMAKES